ncbi:MAG: dnaX 1, partial [Marmoricola sp.]|nr:dnaX 1 [Marmoricola sp.]
VEEPPEHLKFIFATTEPEKVIPTIRSRTHHYPFRLIPPRTLSDYLASLCEKEGVKIDPAALPLVVRAGAGSARDSLSVLDQLLGGAGPDGVTYEVATSLLGYTPDTLLDEVIDAFSAADGGTVFGVVDKVIETGQDPRRFTEDVLRRLRDLVIVSAVPDAPASGLIDVPEDQAERLVAQAARFGKTDLVRAADLFAAGLTEMRGATAPRLLLELICARVLLPGADDSTDGLTARLDRLERRVGVVDSSDGGGAGASVPAPPREARVGGADAAADGDGSGASVPAPPREGAGAANHPLRSSVAPGEPVPSTAAATPARVDAVPAAPSAEAEPAVVEAEAEPEPEVVEAETGTGTGLGLADVRRLWPDLLDRVKAKRRFTWILLSQNAQVIGVEGSILTVGFKTAGARDSFVGGGSEEVLREAAIDAIGADWTVEAIVDPSATPGADTAPRVIKSAIEDPVARPVTSVTTADGSVTGVVATPPDWASDDAAPPGQSPGPPTGQPHPPESQGVQPARPAAAPETIASARGNITQTRPGGQTREKAPDTRDADADRDDPDADDTGLNSTELLQQKLGATVIEEITHE